MSTRSPQVLLKDGDRLELCIERIGTLARPVLAVQEIWPLGCNNLVDNILRRGLMGSRFCLEKIGTNGG